MRLSIRVLLISLFFLLLAGCGAGGSTSSSGSGDWFYHWNCNGDAECLSTNPTGAASGTSDEGPAEAACTPLLQFAAQFWGSAATDSCDQNSNGSSGGGGGGSAPTITGFSTSASAPCTQVTITGTNFPSSVTGATVTIDGKTATVNSVTSTSITVTLPCPMPNFTGSFTVTTSGGNATSASSFTVVNHLYGVAASSSQFVAVGGGGTLLTSPDGSTWTADTSNTTDNFYAVAWSSTQPAFVAVGQSGIILRSTDGINWTGSGVPGNFTDFFAVNWNGSQFVIIGDSGAAFTSPDGITWTQRSLPLSAVFGGLAWSGSGYVAAGGSLGANPTILTSPDGATWTHVTTTAANGNQLLAAAFGGGTFVAVGDAETVITSPTGSTWMARSESQVGNIQGLVWSGSQFVGVGFDTSTIGSVIITSPDGVTWTGRGVSANNRSLNAVTFGKSEYVAVGGYGTIVTSLDGATWTLRAGH